MIGLHCPAPSEKRCTWYMNVSLAIQEMTVLLPVFVDWFPFAVELQQLWGSATEAAPDAKMDAADAKVDAAGSCLSRRFDDNFLHSDTGTQDKLDVHRLIHMNSFAFSSSTKHNNLQAFPLAFLVQLSSLVRTRGSGTADGSPEAKPDGSNLSTSHKSFLQNDKEF